MKTIVKLSPQHLQEVAALEAECMPAPWTEEQISAEITRPLSFSYGLLLDETLAGYALSYLVADELHLLNFAVGKEWRRRGFASELLTAVFVAARDAGASQVFLEVRESNAAARALYEKLGFAETGARKGYYPDTGEAAIELRLVMAHITA